MQRIYKDIFISTDNQLLDAKAQPLEIRALQKQTDVRVWVPSEHVTLAEIDLPTRNSLEIEQSLPYAVEDMLLDDVEKLHFAWQSMDKNQPLQVAVVSKVLMQLWVDVLKPYKLVSPQLIPDIFCVPWQNDTPAIAYLPGDRAILRSGNFSGIASSRQVVDEYVQHQDITPLTYDVQGKNAVMSKDTHTKGRYIQNNTVPFVSEEGMSLPLFDVHTTQHRYINLLQGDYIAGAAFTRIMRRSMGAIVGLAAMALLVVAHQLVQYFMLSAEVKNFQNLVEKGADEIIENYTYGQPLQLLVERKIENQRTKISEIQYTPWSVFEQTIPLLRNCHNCVFENITVDKKSIRITVSSYNPLTLVEKQINSIEGYNVFTDLQLSKKDKHDYSRLQFSIDVQGK